MQNLEAMVHGTCLHEMKTLGGKFANLKQNEEGYLKIQSPFIASTF